MQSSLAHKYANALFEVAEADGAVQSVRDEFTALAELISSNAELLETLENPAIAFQSKRGIVEAISREMGLQKMTTNFVLVILENRRISKLHVFVEALNEVVDASQGIVRGQVRTAQPLDETSRKRLEETMSRKTGKTVHLDVVEDPALIAGVKVEIGSVIYDGSVQTQLERIQKQITSL